MLSRLLYFTTILLLYALNLHAQPQQLIASSYYNKYKHDTAYSFADSSVYHHTQGRNSIAATGYYQYDSSTLLLEAQAPAPFRRTDQTFDVAGNIIAKSFRRYTDTGFYTEGSAMFYHSLVNGAYRLTEEWRDGYNFDKDQSYEATTTYYNYDVQGRLTGYTTGSYIAQQFVPTVYDTTLYDAKGNVTNLIQWIYTATPGNEWARIRKYVLVYDADNKKVMEISYDALNNPERHYTYTYNANGSIATMQEMTLHPTLGWTTGATNKYLYDGQGNLVLHTVSANTPIYRYEYKYNASNQLVEKMYIDYNNWSFPNAHWYRYHYRKLIPSGVQQTETGSMQLSLYPSPAVSTVHVDVSFKTPNTIQGFITDANGRQVHVWHDAKTQQYSKDIQVIDFAAGTYYLTIVAGGEKLTKAFVVMR